MSRHPFAVAVELDGDGAHPAAWRAAGHTPRQLLQGARIAETVRAAERAGFTAATFDDAPLPPNAAKGVPLAGGIAGRLDAIQRTSFAAPLTSSLGLIPVAHAVYSEPFHLATQLATLDHASYGRAGWIVAVDPDARIAVEYGRESVDAARAASDATDAVEVARRLWDTWEGDAVIRDVASGRYFDRERVHYADFEGASFSVKGPSIVPRPPQGQLPVFAAASSGVSAGVDVALIESSASQAVEAARAAGASRVWLELEVALDRAGRPAAERVARLDASEPWAPGIRGRYVGDAAGLVTLLAQLADQLDGVRLHPAVLDDDLDELGRAVLPELRRRGIFTPPVNGSTLRETLALGETVNRYSTRAAIA